MSMLLKSQRKGVGRDTVRFVQSVLPFVLLCLVIRVVPRMPDSDPKLWKTDVSRQSLSQMLRLDRYTVRASVA